MSLGADERKRERERASKVAGFALKPLLCQTCARASAAAAAAAAAASPPLRCVSALAERRTQAREGRGGTPRRRAESPRRSGGTARHCTDSERILQTTRQRITTTPSSSSSSSSSSSPSSAAAAAAEAAAPPPKIKNRRAKERTCAVRARYFQHGDCAKKQALKM